MSSGRCLSCQWKANLDHQGHIIRNRTSAAAVGKKEYQELLDEFSAEVGSTNVDAWTAQVVAWEKNMSLPDPYFVKPSGKS